MLYLITQMLYLSLVGVFSALVLFNVDLKNVDFI